MATNVPKPPPLQVPPPIPTVTLAKSNRGLVAVLGVFVYVLSIVCSGLIVRLYSLEENKVLLRENAESSKQSMALAVRYSIDQTRWKNLYRASMLQLADRVGVLGSPVITSLVKADASLDDIDMTALLRPTKQEKLNGMGGPGPYEGTSIARQH